MSRASRGASHSKPRPPKESRYLIAWGALVAALATAGGLSLYVLVVSITAHSPAPIAAGDPVALGPSAEPWRPAPARPTPPPTAPPSARPPSARPPSAAPPPRRTAAPAPRFRGVDMTSPVERQQISGRTGVVVAGTAGDLGGRRLRIFDFADNGLYYLVDGPGVAIRDGRWSLRYRNIGEGAADVGNTFVMMAVAADAGCERILHAATPNDEGDRPFRGLPPGCELLDRVSVIKAAP